MAKATIPEKIRKLEERYAQELLPGVERLEIRERILKLRRKATTLEAGRR